MIMTPHAITGMFIATFCERRRIGGRWPGKKWVWALVVATASFLSHFLLDGLPHHDYSVYNDSRINTYALGLDALFTLGVFLIIFWSQVKALTKTLQRSVEGRARSKTREGIMCLPLFSFVLCGIYFAWLPDALNVLSAEITTLVRFKQFHDSFHSSTISDIYIGYFLQTSISIILLLLTVSQVGKLKKQMALEFRAEQIGEEAERWFATNEDSK